MQDPVWLTFVEADIPPEVQGAVILAQSTWGGRLSDVKAEIETKHQMIHMLALLGRISPEEMARGCKGAHEALEKVEALVNRAHESCWN